jgi:hypothetical protein
MHVAMPVDVILIRCGRCTPSNVAYIEMRPSALSLDLLVMSRLTSITTKDLAQLGTRIDVQTLIHHIGGRSPLNMENEESAIELAIDMVRSHLDTYTTTYEVYLCWIDQ